MVKKGTQVTELVSVRAGVETFEGSYGTKVPSTW